MPECKLDAKSGIYKEKGSEEALVSLGSETLLESITESWDGAEGAALLESSKCMWNSTIEFVFNPCRREGAREGSTVTVHQGRLLFWEAIIVKQWVRRGGCCQVQVVLEERGREMASHLWPWTTPKHSRPLNANRQRFWLCPYPALFSWPLCRITEPSPHCEDGTEVQH